MKRACISLINLQMHKLTTRPRRWSFDIKLITEAKSDDQGLKLVWDPHLKTFTCGARVVFPPCSVSHVNFQFVSSPNRKKSNSIYRTHTHTRGTTVKRGRWYTVTHSLTSQGLSSRTYDCSLPVFFFFFTRYVGAWICVPSQSVKIYTSAMAQLVPIQNNGIFPFNFLVHITRVNYEFRFLFFNF